jgi:imidazoleglycerol-phosphate dehydratase
MRVAEVRRDTAETQIQVSLNLDGSGQRSLDSGLPFLDICWTRLHGTGSLIW